MTYYRTTRAGIYNVIRRHWLRSGRTDDILPLLRDNRHEIFIHYIYICIVCSILNDWKRTITNYRTYTVFIRWQWMTVGRRRRRRRRRRHDGVVLYIIYRVCVCVCVRAWRRYKENSRIYIGGGVRRQKRYIWHGPLASRARIRRPPRQRHTRVHTDTHAHTDISVDDVAQDLYEDYSGASGTSQGTPPIYIYICAYIQCMYICLLFFAFLFLLFPLSFAENGCAFAHTCVLLYCSRILIDRARCETYFAAVLRLHTHTRIRDVFSSKNFTFTTRRIGVIETSILILIGTYICMRIMCILRHEYHPIYSDHSPVSVKHIVRIRAFQRKFTRRK